MFSDRHGGWTGAHHQPNFRFLDECVGGARRMRMMLFQSKSKKFALDLKLDREPVKVDEGEVTCCHG